MWEGSGLTITPKILRVFVGIGYSGFPRGCPDSVFPWSAKNESTNWLHTKDPYICDAVSNAILNKCTPDVAGARIYVMEYPNSESAKVIIQSGIKQVIILGEDKNQHDVEIQAGRILLSMADVDVRFHRPSISSLLLDFVGSMTPTTSNDDSCTTSANDAVARKKIEQELNQQQLAKELLLKEANYDASLVKDNGMSRNYISWQDYL